MYIPTVADAKAKEIEKIRSSSLTDAFAKEVNQTLSQLPNDISPFELWRTTTQTGCNHLAAVGILKRLQEEIPIWFAFLESLSDDDNHKRNFN